MVSDSKNIVYFVYDGECPLCKLGASFYKLRQSVGALEIVDARTQADHFVVKEVNRAALNLDDGMVIKYFDKLYHGADALHLMAQLGVQDDILNMLNSKLYKSRKLVDICYPVLKGFRNLLLRIKGVDQIKNLEN